jgi:glycerol-3-phosphate acyltransferase PlsY
MNFPVLQRFYTTCFYPNSMLGALQTKLAHIIHNMNSEAFLSLPSWVIAFGACVLAYLMGSLSFAVLVSKAFGLEDPRTFGSKNPGATNVLRTGNKAAAALTLLLDAFKGWLPVFLFVHGLDLLPLNSPLGQDWLWLDMNPRAWMGAVGLSAFLGHLFPVFFAFKGGKGVATALGVLIGFEPILGLLTLLCWLGAAKIWRYSSLSALLASVFAPLAYLLMDGELWQSESLVLVCSVIMSALLLYRHKANLERLFKGQEDKIGAKKNQPQ